MLSEFKGWLKNIWDTRRLLLYIIAGVVLVLFLLSFFIDVGYIYTVLAVLGMVYFSNRVSKEDPDILRIDENTRKNEEQEYHEFIAQLRLELDNLDVYLEQNPTDFVARKRRNEIYDFLTSEN